MSALISIPRLLARGALLLAALLVVTYFALTRTEVGRDALRAEIERQFGRAFDGRLAIGRLSGNLAQDVFASDVRLYDGEDRLVLAVDSVAFKPHWRDLFDRSVTSGRVYLYSPQLHVVFDSAGTNLAGVFTRGVEALDEATPWSFRSADVRIINGSVRSTNRGYHSEAIERGLVFNYADLSADEINGRAHLELGREETFIDLRSLTLEASKPDVAVRRLSGQLDVRRDALLLRRLEFEAGESHGALAARIPRPVFSPDSSGAVRVDVEPSHLDRSFVRSLFPALPMSDNADVRLRIAGTPASLVIEEASVARGRSTVNLSGTVLGLPHRADFEVALDESTIAYADVHAVWPELPLEMLQRVGMVRGEAYARGEIDLGHHSTRPLSAAGSLRLRSASGAVSGPFSIDRDSTGSVSLSTTIDAERLIAQRFFLELPPGRTELSGRARVEGRFEPSEGYTGTAAVTLARSWLDGQFFDSLAVDLVREKRGLRMMGTARQGEAFAAARAALMGDSLDAAVAVRDLDAGRWWLRGDSVRTRLNGRIEISGRGRGLDAFDARILAEVDSSVIWHGHDASIIPPHRHLASISQLDGAPRLQIRGDVAEIDLTADASLADARPTLDLWRSAFTAFLENEKTKRLRNPADSIAVQAAAFAANPEAPPVRITGHARVIDSRILAVIYDDFAGLGTDMTLDADLRMDGRSFQLSGKMRADSVAAPGIRGDSIRTDLRVVASLDSAVLHPDIHLTLRADSIGTPIRTFAEARVDLSFDGNDGRLSASSARGGMADFLIDAAIHNNPTQRRMILERLRFSVGDEWSLERPASIDLYSDAILVRSLRLATHNGDATPQRVEIGGVLSANEQDTLRAGIDRLQLGRISELLRLEQPLTGALGGRLALTGLGTRPELTGHLGVADVHLDGHRIGDVRIESRYEPGRPDVLLDARVLPDRSGDPDAPRNDVHLHGTFRLPAFAVDRTMTDPGAFDLQLAAAHADAFFFDLIFGEISDARGVLSGTGAVRGDWRRPVFEARLSLTDGGMRVPEFNLAYDVEGDVSVDSAAIRLHGVDVRDATGGHAVVDGAILFNEYRYFSFDLGASLHETQFMNVMSSRNLAFYGDVRASGNVTLTGPLHEATLASADAVIHPDSRVYIAIMEETGVSDSGFLVFADATGRVPDLTPILRRRHVLSQRPEGERMFVDGLAMDLNIRAPQGTSVHLVVDPLLGDVINATASGRIQLQRREGDYAVFGRLEADAGDYVFTAGDLFVRRFLIDGGSISWDGDPANAELDISASYRTRASAAGLNIALDERTRIPLIVQLNITGRVAAPSVGLRLVVDHDGREALTSYEGLESILNQPERSAEYATSVMLTNSFLLTTSITSSGEAGLATTRNQLAFNSLSQLVASQLNRYLSHALPNLDVNLGLQGESTQDIDVTYGVALRLLDERLVIRGQGIYQNETYTSAQQNLLDEFVVELRMSNSVSVEVFYRRENDILASDHTLANTTGAGLSYETQFASWPRLIDRLLGRRDGAPAAPADSPDVIAGNDDDSPGPFIDR